MDELENRMRSSMSRAVDGWNPTPDQLRLGAPVPRQARRLRVGMALAAALILILGAGGIAIGLEGGGHPKPASLAAADPSQSAEPTRTATECATPPAGALGYDCFGRRFPGPAIGACPTAGSTVGLYVPLQGASGSGPYSSSICLSTASPSNITASLPVPGTSELAVGPATPVPGTPGATPSVTPTTVIPVPMCPKSNFRVTVTTDKSSYVTKMPVAIDVSVRSKMTCDTPDDYNIIGSVTQGSSTGAIVEGFGSYCPLHDGVDPKCPAPISVPPSNALKHWKAGQAETATDTWNQATGDTSGGFTYADPGTYVVTVTAGDVGGSTHFVITAPACTPDQLTVSLSSDQSTYSQGQTAHLSGTVTNTSTSTCLAPYVIADPIAIDSSGATVWTDCEGTDENEQADGSCTNGLVAYSGGKPLAPGAVLMADQGIGPLGTGTSPQQFTWNLGKTGSTTSDPKPVPDGTYTISWQGVGMGYLKPATITVTITG